MKPIEQETICALSTPSGVGAIAAIRVSGTNSIVFCEKVVKTTPPLSKVPPRKLVLGKIYTQDQNLLDEVMVAKFHQPNSYTGENMVEIFCHGGSFITSQIMEIFLAEFRLAQRGEFTKRAFLNGKIDLTKAEAIVDLIDSKNRHSHSSAARQYLGKLFGRVQKLLQQMTDIRVELELEIDFLEQNLEEIDIPNLKKRLTHLQKKLLLLARSAEDGMVIHDGLIVALVGAPNVGKSTIFNAFLQKERAIVTPYPGTTRDYLQETLVLDGFLVKLVDTAGLRTTKSVVEKIGIDKTLDQIKEAHIVFCISDIDTIQSGKKKFSLLAKNQQVVEILNKSDLLDDKTISTYRRKGYTICSAKTKDGLENLREIIVSFCKKSISEIDSGILTNTRQKALVKKSCDFVQKAISSLDKKMGYEFTAFDLAQASDALEQIVGKVENQAMLDRIFNNFCIGK